MRKLQMRKLLMTISLIVLLLSLVGCGKTTKPKPRSVDITGNWTVKNPPKPPIPKGFPKGYVPPTPTYMLTFSSGDVENRFALSFADKTSQGTYILSGTTIQLIPAGKNYVFEFGKTKKEDRIRGDGFIWTRVGAGNNNVSPPSPPPAPSPTPTPTPTPVNPTTPTTPVPPPPNL